MVYMIVHPLVLFQPLVLQDLQFANWRSSLSLMHVELFVVYLLRWHLYTLCHALQTILANKVSHIALHSLPKSLKYVISASLSQQERETLVVIYMV